MILDSDRILCERSHDQQDQSFSRESFSREACGGGVVTTCDIVNVVDITKSDFVGRLGRKPQVRLGVMKKGENEFGISVANLLRAHGGCLGVERRRRAWKSAKILGELTNKL